MAEPLSDATARQILPLIEHFARIARRAYDAFQPPDCLRPRHLIALNLLHEHGPLSQHVLGEALSLDPSNVVGLLNDLEERGLVTRRRDPADRRRHIVALSDAGGRALAASAAQITGIEDNLFKALAPAERATLYELLVRALGASYPSCEAPACETPAREAPARQTP